MAELVEAQNIKGTTDYTDLYKRYFCWTPNPLEGAKKNSIEFKGVKANCEALQSPLIGDLGVKEKPKITPKT